MASLSSASAQIRVHGGGGTFFKKRSLKYSNGGVSFALLSPRSSFLASKTSSYNRRTANGIIPVPQLATAAPLGLAPKRSKDSK